MTTFDKALSHLRQGLVVYRAADYFRSETSLLNYLVLDPMRAEEHIQERLAVFTHGGGAGYGCKAWNPSQEDLLARDWVLTELQEKTFISTLKNF